MLRFLILIIILLVSTKCYGEGEYTLILGVHTSHFSKLECIDNKLHYNNRNNIIGIEKTLENNTSISLIYFNNSFYNDTLALLYTKKFNIKGNLKCFISSGITYGYNDVETLEVTEKHYDHYTTYISNESHDSYVWHKLSLLVGAGFEYKYISILINPSFYNVQLKIPIGRR